MTSKRQPKLRTSLRVWAVVWLLALVSASAFCAGDGLFNHSHGDEGQTTAPADGHSHEPDAASAEGVASHSHDSKSNSHDDGADGGSCCSTLKAVSQAASSTILPKLDFAKLVTLHFVLLSQTLTVTKPENSPLRQSSPRDWVFTPEVCLGPAFRSLAPPVAS